MSGTDHLVLFNLDDHRLALPMAGVERISRSVEITPLPKAPSSVLGIINVQGRVVPVVDIRKKFGLPARPMHLSDHFIIAKTSKRPLALLVDTVTDIIETGKQNLVSQDQIFSEIEYLHGVLKLPDGMLLVNDLEKFLTSDEEESLEQALAQAVKQTGQKKEKGRRKGNSNEKGTP
jgi:purine-binding chemotaxis protein CheW